MCGVGSAGTRSLEGMWYGHGFGEGVLDGKVLLLRRTQCSDFGSDSVVVFAGQVLRRFWVDIFCLTEDIIGFSRLGCGPFFLNIILCDNKICICQLFFDNCEYRRRIFLGQWRVR